MSPEVGMEVGKFVFFELLNSNRSAKWRIGNNINECQLCGKCQSVCPSDAISVSKHNRTWTLNNMRCGKCLQCVLKCSARCLTQVSR